MNITEDKIISEIFAEDYRTTAVFQSFGIDFTGKGNRTITEVCGSRNIEPQVLIVDLHEVMQQDYKSVN